MLIQYNILCFRINVSEKYDVTLLYKAGKVLSCSYQASLTPFEKWAPRRLVDSVCAVCVRDDKILIH
jgi:hypothetical protein